MKFNRSQKIVFLTAFLFIQGCSQETNNSSQSSLSPTVTSIVSSINETEIPSNTNVATKIPTREPELDIRCSSTTAINIRSGPGFDYDIVSWLLEWECVIVIETTQDGNWAKTDQEWLGTYHLASSNGGIPITQVPTAPPTPTKTPIPTPTIRPTRVPPTTIPTDAMMQCWQSYKYWSTLQTCKMHVTYCAYRPDIYGQPTFCNDGPFPNHGFTLLVWGHNWSDYDGYCLIVKGYIEMYEGKPQIVAESRSQISYCR